MKGPLPAEEFLGLLLKSEEVVSACNAENGEKSAHLIEQAAIGYGTDFLEWFEGWRMDGHEELVFAIEGAAYYNDTFWININRSGPLDELGAGAVDRFWRWAERFADVLRIDSKGPVVLTAPEWGY